MSTGKFKTGDLVEYIGGDNPNPEMDKSYPDMPKKGYIGKIIAYGGQVENYQFNTVVYNGWKVNFPHCKITWIISEKTLRLVPGGEEYKEVGNWDECPWAPNRQKIELPKVSVDLTNPFEMNTEYDF